MVPALTKSSLYSSEAVASAALVWAYFSIANACKCTECDCWMSPSASFKLMLWTGWCESTNLNKIITSASKVGGCVQVTCITMHEQSGVMTLESDRWVSPIFTRISEGRACANDKLTGLGDLFLEAEAFKKISRDCRRCANISWASWLEILDLCLPCFCACSTIQHHSTLSYIQSCRHFGSPSWSISSTTTNAMA